MTEWNIGCSGFHYKHWKEIFYPKGLPQTRWFEYYCQYFNTLELNTSFYRFPKLTAFESWYQRSPENFKFSIKAPRAITHYKKFLDSLDMLNDFYNLGVEGLKEKLGCVLFQLPPNYLYSEERLERLIRNLNPAILNVVEFRHESWWREEAYQELTRHNISFCGMSHPTLPKDLIKNTSLVYYRFHGESALYASNYDEQQLEQIAFKLKGFKSMNHAFIYFNNDIHGHAIKNALTLKHLLTK